MGRAGCRRRRAAAFAAAARELGLQGVEVRRPEAAEAVEPGVDVAQAVGVDRVQAAGAVGADRGEAGLAQDAQVGRDAGLGDAELALDDRADRARGLLAVGEQLEDAAADGIAEDVEGVRHAAYRITCYLYKQEFRRRLQGARVTLSTHPSRPSAPRMRVHAPLCSKACTVSPSS